MRIIFKAGLAFALLLSWVVPAQTASAAVSPVASPTPLPSEARLAISHLNRGNEAYNSGNYAEALKQFDTCLKMDPRNRFCFYNAALTHHQLGNFGEAIKHFTQAIIFDTDWADAYAARARSRMSVRDWRECARDFAAAIDSGQRTAANLGGRGECLSRSGDHPAAIRALDSAIELEPRAAFLVARARSLNELGETARAQADLERARPTSENGLDYQLVLGDVAARSGRLADAMAAYDRAIVLAPTLGAGQAMADSELPGIYYRKGRVYERQGRAMLAFESYSTAVEMGGHADSQKAREAVYAKLSAQEKAAADRRMGRLSPTQAAALQPRPTPGPVRATPTPATPRPAATPTRTPSPQQPTARTTAPAPRPTPVPPGAAVANANDFDDAYQKANEAAKSGDHRSVVAYTTQAIQLLPQGQQPKVLEDVTLSIHVSMLLLRARAHAALNDQAASDTDFEAATKGAMDGTDRHHLAASQILGDAKTRSDLGALTLSGAEMDKALVTCRRAIDIADEWRVTANAHQSGRGAIRAALLLTGAREICVETHISRANAVANTPFFSGPATGDAERRRREYRQKAIGILTEAIKFADLYPKLYQERAKLYRLTGQAALAAADEARARELAGGN